MLDIAKQWLEVMDACSQTAARSTGRHVTLLATNVSKNVFHGRMDNSFVDNSWAISSPFRFSPRPRAKRAASRISFVCAGASCIHVLNRFRARIGVMIGANESTPYPSIIIVVKHNTMKRPQIMITNNKNGEARLFLVDCDGPDSKRGKVMYISRTVRIYGFDTRQALVTI